MNIDITSQEIGIPKDELEVLLALPYKKETTLPRPIALKNLGFALDVMTEIRTELDEKLMQGRKDAQKNVDHAFRLIICNLVVCVFTRERLALPGEHKAYNSGSYYHKLRLTRRAVKTVTEALQGKYIEKKKGNTYKKQVNGYKPTKKLELKILPLIYQVYEQYNPEEPMVIFKQTEEASSLESSLEEASEVRTEQEHVMQRRSSIELETTYETDQLALIHINEALKDATYALKSPVKRIYSHNDPMQGGRLYVRLQSLPDRRARIRINTLLNGKSVAEVDLSANHPRMLMALEGEELPDNFYHLIAQESNTTRDKVKFLVMKMIGAKNKSISLVIKEDEEDWFKSKFMMTQEDRRKIEAAIAEKFPKLNAWFYKGKGIYLQALEGDILLKTMLLLLDQGILSLPIHDAVYVQREHVEQARIAIENAWMESLGVSFKPYTKVDLP